MIMSNSTGTEFEQVLIHHKAVFMKKKKKKKKEKKKNTIHDLFNWSVQLQCPMQKYGKIWSSIKSSPQTV